MNPSELLPVGINNLAAIWVYLSATPLFGLTLTLVAYVLADMVYQRTNRHPLANPVLIAVTFIIVVLTLTKIDYKTYFEGAQFVHFLLGTATVALAIPLARLWTELRARAIPLLVAVFAGGASSVLVAVAVAKLLAAPPTIAMSLLPKSVTSGRIRDQHRHHRRVDRHSATQLFRRARLGGTWLRGGRGGARDRHGARVLVASTCGRVCELGDGSACAAGCNCTAVVGETD
jgi:hypothetical protein